MIRCTARFKPSLLTTVGTWQELKGEWDGTLFWATEKGVRFGVELTSRTVLYPEAVAEAPMLTRTGANLAKAEKAGK